MASFLVSDYAGFINGEVVTIDGGEWLQGAGEFNFLIAMKNEEFMLPSLAKKARIEDD